MCWYLLEICSRKKPPGEIGKVERDAKLGKVYYTRDMVAYGVGSTLGAGVYVLAGQAAKEKAGPAVLLSFLIAASGSALSGLCYAEFGGRVPRSGSAYNFSYICIGEVVAFVIGWDLILEYAIGSASIARAFGSYLDSAINKRMSSAFKSIYYVESQYFEEYFDFFAFTIVLLIGIGQAFGLRQVKWVNNTFVCINLCVIAFTIIAGCFFAKLSNWSLPAPEDPALGKGGYFPFGVEGVVAGAAEVFFAFVGFDGIACAGEELYDPAKSIPRAIILTLLICFIVYAGISCVITLMLPYYLQDSDAPITFIFQENNFEVGKWIVFVGGLCALTTSLFGCMYPLPRMIYAMSKDRMLFAWCGLVNERFKTPVVGTMAGASLTAVLAATLKLDALVDMMSIGTLLAYTLVSMGILMLRYAVDDPNSTMDFETLSCKQFWQYVFKRQDEEPTPMTNLIAVVFTYVYILLSLAVVLVLKFTDSFIFKGQQLYWLGVVAVLFVFMLLTLGLIQNQPKSQLVLPYKVPFVPWVPAFSIFMNMYVMSKMDLMTWIRFMAWCVLGLVIYVSYSYWHSKQRRNRQGEYVNEEPAEEAAPPPKNK